MKKFLLVCALGAAFASAAAAAVSEKPVLTTVSFGDVTVYDYGDIKLHAYRTGDNMADECYVLELGAGLVLLESTAYKDNVGAFSGYVRSLGKPLMGAFLSYHSNGYKSYPKTTIYATKKALASWGEGGGVLAANRMLSTDGSVNSYQTWYLYEDSVDIDSSKPVQALTFTSTSELGWDGYQPVVSIFALSALTQQVISGIEETRMDDFGPVVREYYDMQGRRLPQQQRGMQIVVERTARGKVSSRKVIYQ